MTYRDSNSKMASILNTYMFNDISDPSTTKWHRVKNEIYLVTTPLTTPDTWFRPLFGGLRVLWLLRPVSQTLHRLNDLPKLTFTELKGFHGAFATGVACQQGALTLPDTWFRPPFWDLLMLQLLRPNSSNLPCLYSTFHLEYPLVLSRFCLVMYAHI